MPKLSINDLREYLECNKMLARELLTNPLGELADILEEYGKSLMEDIQTGFAAMSEAEKTNLRTNQEFLTLVNDLDGLTDIISIAMEKKEKLIKQQ
ncbi:hypothetical protein [Paenibacillus taichungensis]|uniref:hypothetical protein n=1 Tax=Paenibacillus taichungensis TaxID=484184 RepID=UPI0039A2BE1B